MNNVILKIKKIDCEWCVLWIENGIINEDKTYYSLGGSIDDKKDCELTKEHIIKNNYYNK